MSLRFSRLDRTSMRRLLAGQVINEHGITVERLGNGVAAAVFGTPD